MVVAVAIWSLVLQPGKAESVIPPGDLKITNIALGEELADENSRTSVRLVYSAPRAPEDSEDEDEDEEDIAEEPTPTILCSLTPGKIEQAHVELILEAEQEVVFETVGKNVVYLTGNYIDQQPDSDQPPYDDDDSDDEGLPLEEYGSDVELEADELVESDDDADRFEEIIDDEEVPAPQPEKPSKKRARESDAMETDEQPKKPSKAEKKKLKKQKADDGKAVTTAEEKAEVEVKEKAQKEEKKNEKEEKKNEKKEKQKREEKELTGGIKSWDHKVGTGPQAKSGDKVSVRYVGKLTNGKVFDSNTKGKPFMFRLGAGEVIKGWDIGVAGMQVGGERLLTIPAPMAYGKRAQQGIPANSTLVFEIKLVKIN